MAELVSLTATETVAAVRARQVSAVDLVEACLGRIEAVEPAVNAFITVDAEQALAAARASERQLMAGEPTGPLHGVPVAVKDNIDTRGLRSTAGSRILADRVPGEDAGCVARLRTAGAIVLGKTNLHEFAWGGTTENPHYGPTRNPWDPERFVAGSSGGSAACVAAREAPVALGTDTGGSIRLPAAACGVAGLRPTIGRVSNHGTIPCAWTMDTVGPLARTVADCALLTEVIAGHDPRDPVSAAERVEAYGDALEGGARGIVVGVPQPFALAGVQPGVQASIASALDVLGELGAEVVDVSLPELEQVRAPWLVVHSAEPSAYHAEWLRTRPDDYGDDVRAALEAGEALRAVDYIQAQRFRAHLRTRMLEAMRTIDVLVTPTMPFAATPLSATTVELDEPGVEEPMLAHIARFTAVPSTAGLPALSVPGGPTAGGLPVGMQLIGRPFEEEVLLRLGHSYQRATDHHLRAPAL